MKKIFPIALTFVLAGCVGGATTSQILTQTTEEEVMPVTQTVAVNLADDAVTQEAMPVPKPAPKPVVTEKPKMTKPVSTAKPAPKPVTKPAMTSGSKYTIQVVALSHNKGFGDYVNKLPSDKPVWSNKKMVDGLPWYTLLYGEYNSKADAKKALNALPKNIKAYGPFIRSMASIKSSATPEMIRVN
ncbi:SPOR domain-containing protein [Enterovibrio sp. ZSDZ35]|uniref:SPOR domain-containing protein n=1 Tax=Enterovibrio qingdaonensis TaxID=2899818 RepID=A0ABT5QFA5_9GAMM|nr:SPOR domain-containing protein [Enterovibrio sp. ZSDZ35]MDD1779653.1 SPOR domain-containing protein [Enterovibrio sp. ZSDZ35]